ncbi:MAG: endolytic transglycosylase MltG [Salinivirgaceae bacterium]|nr:endolytic transglycosylase MltG [Salinivirgaceae bacterium]
MVKKKKNKNKRFFIKFTTSMLLVFILIGGFKAYQMYKVVEEPNVNLNGQQSSFIYIPTGSDYLDLTTILYESGIIINRSSFEWVAEKKNYPTNVKPGRYEIKESMSNNELVNLLRSGRQTPVKLVFNKVRTKEVFAGIIAKQIEADSAELVIKLNNHKFLSKYSKNKETAMTLFIPNTYELYWNTNAESFVARMNKEYERFWNDKRRKKATEIGMTPDEVITLASIVEEETIKNDEKEALAGVYVNRLKKNIRLGADPTVRFALGDFNIKRILNKHLEYQSPYNTYRNSGLPPGPICLPSITTIDAVLNYEKHKYLYFCAKDDFSGYHVFAKTLKQHNQNAAKFHRALNNARIYR